ncbi:MULTISPECIES: YfbM family protein [unclassified Pseudoalteromonas]|uniref:YfbM family protein n=1 Tax=unclassified Pseudoalteromonas TaxID=194690 RepID=UPI0007314E48|nr:MULTISPECIES: YfbM family protein [unclassified Pseudoalteromonas]KTD91835.1 hypothetical protein ATS71_06070 [Pseudoalteromonas sp. H71]MBW4966104.1 YfbM family protein [Pseudoalteromonas sp. CR1]TMN84635.1 DUF1877 domain-containing protein [Pseudoalteromonas sp. S410]TMN91148.1 DUF1877 domain-containing protein [Pseudoalteromonas sp. S408]TMN98027.1 DUF1877 domain-containing protein [Pseudoalteromonas sp. S407]|tara:strand:- start:51 stop:524 length:474 start_codon:yes stop_codon:yes gene_type:complete
MSMIASLKSVNENKLKSLLSNPDGLTSYLYEEDGKVCDVDKAWHAIHFLLNKAVWEFSSIGGSVFLGGTPISDEDVGYGPARYFTAEESAAISEELMEVSDVTLLKHFEALVSESEIYPGFSDNEEDREYIAQNFTHLKEFCSEVVKSGNSIITYMC